MSATPARRFALPAAATIVAAILVCGTLLVVLGAPATVTKTSTSTQVSTSTIVSTSTVTTTCVEGPQLTTPELLFYYNSSTDCQLGVTIYLSANPGIITGTNESFTVSLTNDELSSRNISYTGFPQLQDGLNSSSLAWYDDVLPLQPACGLPSTSSFEPAFIVVYTTNSTGSVLITPNIGSYYQLSIAYQSATYSVRAPIEPMTTTYVTLSIPSGNVTITEVFEGGCQTNSGGVTCPG